MKKHPTGTSTSLIDAMRPEERHGEIESLVLSTYGLGMDQPNFFEQDFLPTVLGLGGARDRGYAVPVALERKLGDLQGVLVCDAHALAEGARPSLRIDVVPIGVRKNHAKIVLINRRHRVRLIVSSANLSHQGYRTQREVAAILDFEQGGALPGSVLRLATESWISVLGEAAPQSLLHALSSSVRRAESLAPSRQKVPVSVVFGGGTKPLWRHVVDEWPEGEPLLSWKICSPFWPDPSGGETPFETIATALVARGVKMDGAKIDVLAAGDAPGEKAKPLFPFEIVRRLRDESFPIRRGQIIPVRLDALPEEVPQGKAESQRDLHAKWLALIGPKTTLLLLGSANFTRRGFGTLRDPLTANIEACVLLKTDSRALNAEQLMPPIASTGVVAWESCAEPNLAIPAPVSADDVAWPQFISRIELAIDWSQPRDPGGNIRAIVSSDWPEFRIRVEVVSSEGGLSESSVVTLLSPQHDSPSSLECHIECAAVRAILARRLVVVEWDKNKRSTFPVNIDDASKADLPSVLGARPNEQELLAYFHGRVTEDDLLTLLDDRARGKGPQPDRDPDQMARIQSYVIRDFVESLFGMSEMLRGATLSPRAFEQALVGDFSPQKLAEAVLQTFTAKARSSTATAFQLVEILRAVATLEIPQRGEDLKEELTLLNAIRERAIKRLFRLVAAAAQSAQFRQSAAAPEFVEYARASLPPRLIAEWVEVVRRPATAVRVIKKEVAAV